MSFKIVTNREKKEPTIQVNPNDVIKQRVPLNEPVGNVMQSAPMIFSRSGHNMWFGDMYRGSSAFLVLGGPSFEVIYPDYKDKLHCAGILTASVNNAISSIRTDLWFSSDAPSQFVRSVWDDPKIMKFSPYERSDDRLFDSNEWKHINKSPKDCPNSWFFKRNDEFNADTFMTEDSFNWGSIAEFGGNRSVMLVAIKMLYYLGVRKVYLLGCDFKMTEDSTYHFDQDRHDSSIKGNNATYAALSKRFTQLKPIFDSLGYEIYNCNEDSELQVFPYRSVESAYQEMRVNAAERTGGLYDREYNLRKNQRT